jgi:hypothetical protein
VCERPEIRAMLLHDTAAIKTPKQYTLSMVTIEMVSCDTRAVELLALISEVDALSVTRGADESMRPLIGLYGPHDLVGSGNTAADQCSRESVKNNVSRNRVEI